MFGHVSPLTGIQNFMHVEPIVHLISVNHTSYIIHKYNHGLNIIIDHITYNLRDIFTVSLSP